MTRRRLGLRPGARPHLRRARARSAVDAQVPGHVAAAAAARTVAEPHVSAAGLDCSTRSGVAPPAICSTASTRRFAGLDALRGARPPASLTHGIGTRRRRKRCRRREAGAHDAGPAAAVAGARRGTAAPSAHLAAVSSARPAPNGSGARTRSTSVSPRRSGSSRTRWSSPPGIAPRCAGRRWRRDAGAGGERLACMRRLARRRRRCAASSSPGSTAGSQRRVTGRSRRRRGDVQGALRDSRRTRTCRRRTGRRARMRRATTSSRTCRSACRSVRRRSARRSSSSIGGARRHRRPRRRSIRYSNLVAGEKRSRAERLAGVQRHASIRTSRSFPASRGSLRPKTIAVTVANNQKGGERGDGGAAGACRAGRVEPASAPVTFAREDEASHGEVHARAARQARRRASSP